MKDYVITISRQFGCGAHEIATKLSEKLSIPYYDKEILKRAAKDSGFDERLFVFYDEKPTGSFLFNISADGYTTVTDTGITLEDKIFQYQFDTIRKLAEEGSCIIIGRCSDYVLRDFPNLLKIFLHANNDFRRERVINQYGISEKSAAKEIKITDKKRARFHNFYSEYKWGDACNYDLSIDVSRIGIDDTVELIADYINKKYA